MMCDGRAPRPAPPSPPPSVRLPPRGSPLRAIFRAICDQYDELRGCYSDALWRDPKTEGRVTVQLDVRADGSIGEVCFLDTAIDDREQLECIRTRFESLELPALGARTRVVYPLRYVLKLDESTSKPRYICDKLREEDEADGE